MKKLIYLGLMVSICSFNSAFARNLGVLNEDQKPQELVPASDFLNYVASSDHAQESSGGPTTSQNARSGHESDLWGYGYGYYGGYYPYYGYGYYWDQSSDSQTPQAVPSDHMTASRSNTDASRSPVVCFASDVSGNWYANADVAARADKVQESVNHECVAGGSSCAQNLGCALAYR